MQSMLDFAPPAERMMLIGPTPRDIANAQKEQTVRVLRMLQAGPQTTHTFLEAQIGRFGARINELRLVGWRITTKKLGSHSALYVLVGTEGWKR